MTLREAIEQLYRQVAAPAWAAPNLDGLHDVLRDLSWLPAGPVELVVPSGLDGDDAARLREVLATSARESAGSPRPVSHT